MIRFGVLTWLPLYLLETKGFTKAQMGTAFAIFEWAAIPSTLLAGWLTDTYFKRSPHATCYHHLIRCGRSNVQFTGAVVTY